MSWWYVSSPALTGAVEVVNDVITQAPPILRRFIGQPAKNLGNWLRSQGDVTFEKLEEAPRWSNGKTADCQSANGGSIPPRGLGQAASLSATPAPSPGRSVAKDTFLSRRRPQFDSESGDYIYTWGNNEKRATLKGRPCKLVARGTSMRSVMVEFENGQREIVSYRALRERTSP